MRVVVTLGLAMSVLAGSALATEISAPSSVRTLLELTAYDDGFAFVRERRGIDLPAAITDVALEGVSPRLLPPSVIVSGEGVRIHGVRYDFAVLSPDTLLQRSIGKEVSVMRTNPKTGEEVRERATVISTNGGLVLRFADRIETGQPDRLAFDALPEGLRTRPTLLATIETETGGKRQIELSYLTAGVDWNADYALTFEPARERLTINGRAILSNRSGTDFPNASVSLIAGDINRATPPTPMPMRSSKAEAMMAAAPAAPPAREAIGGAHLYSLPQPITIADDETRQIPLFAAADVPATVVYISAASPYPASLSSGVDRSHPQLQISFTNGARPGQRDQDPAAKGPGVPLPAGTARVYVADSSGSPRLIGEDRINHTPIGERVELEPGRAFDITVSRKQTAFTRIDLAQNIYESAYAISVRNAKDRAATVRLVETLPGDWQILDESTPHQKQNANSVVWPVNVPAGGEVEVTYKVRVRL